MSFHSILIDNLNIQIYQQSKLNFYIYLMNKSPSNIQLQRQKINKYREKIQKDLGKTTRQEQTIMINTKPNYNNSHHIKSIYPQRSIQKTQRKIVNYDNNHNMDDQLRNLLTQNRELTMLMYQKNDTIKLLEKKHIEKQRFLSQSLQTQIKRLRSQKQGLLIGHDKQANILIGQIAKLHEQINLIQNQNKKRQENRIFQHKKTIQSIQQSNNQNIAFLNKVIRSEKDLVHQKNTQIQRLLGQIQQLKLIQSNKDLIMVALKQQIEHFKHINKISISQGKIQTQNEISKIRKQTQELLRQEKVVSLSKINKLQLNIQELIIQNQRNIHEIQILKQQIVLNQSQADLEKQRIKKEIVDVQVQQKDILKKQKLSFQNFNEKKIKILEQSHQQLILQKDLEIKKLLKINENRSKQIKNLLREIQDLRKNYLDQQKIKEKIIKNMQQKLKELQNNKSIQLQAMKTKVAILGQGNMKSLKQFYQHQLQLLKSQIFQKNKIIEQNRKNISSSIKDRQELRKQLCAQISALKLSILNIKSQNHQIKLQNFEQFAENQTGNQLLINKYKKEYQFYLKELTISEQKNKKLQKMIQAKDLQIQELHKKIILLKEKYQNQIVLKQDQLKKAAETNQKLSLELKKEKEYYQKQLQKKLQDIKTSKDYFSNQIKEIKRQQNQQFYKIIHQLNADKSLLEEQLSKVKRQCQNVKNQFQICKKMQTLQIERLKNDMVKQKEKYTQDQEQILKQLKDHYSELLSSKEDQLTSKKEQIKQNQRQINDLRENYQQLSKKFQDVIDSFSQKDSLQKKILQMHANNAHISNFVQVATFL